MNTFRLSRSVAGAAILVALFAVPVHAQGRRGGSVPGGMPPGAPDAEGDSSAVGLGNDPIGFLLEYRDSLHLADSTRQQLIRLNLDLFRRNARLRMAIDSVSPPSDDRGYVERPSAEVRERLRPLIAERNANIAAARDAALALLTDEQKARVEQLAVQMRARLGRGQGGRGPRN